MIDLFSSIVLALPVALQLLSMIPLLIGVLLLPKLFRSPRLLMLIGTVLLALTVLQHPIVVQIAAGGASPENISSNILMVSSVFMIVGFVGMVLLGSGVWMLARELRKFIDAAVEETDNP